MRMDSTLNVPAAHCWGSDHLLPLPSPSPRPLHWEGPEVGIGYRPGSRMDREKAAGILADNGRGGSRVPGGEAEAGGKGRRVRE